MAKREGRTRGRIFQQNMQNFTGYDANRNAAYALAFGA
jgi:hypothetical protein